MSLDVGVHLYFPVATVTAAFQATRKALRRKKFALGIQIVAPDGEIVRMPVAADGDNVVSVTDADGGDVFIEVPTISPLFPEVKGPEPTFPLLEGVSIWGVYGEVAYRRGGKVVDSRAVSLQFSRGREYVEIVFSNLTSRDVDMFYTPRFRSKVEMILTEGGGTLAAYQAMGEWATFAEQTPIDVPREMNTSGTSIDDFVSYLLDRIGGDPGGGQPRGHVP